MRFELDPGKAKKTINFIDNVTYTTQTDLEGNPLEVKMALLLQNGNIEMRLASGKDDELTKGRQRPIVWFNGAGWHHVDKNIMTAAMMYLAEHGYALIIAQYRGSEKAKWPAQIEDAKTAIRFLQANADKYHLDTSKIGVIGRSAGGHLSSLLAMNTDEWITDEYSEYSSEVQACVDMFGPADMPRLHNATLELLKDPNYRWHRPEQTHTGMLMGGDMDTVAERLESLSPMNLINEKICPMLILHGDEDPLIPVDVSEKFYEKIVEAGYGDQTDLCIIKHGGHGTREFFQDATKQVILNFFDKYIGTEC